MRFLSELYLEQQLRILYVQGPDPGDARGSGSSLSSALRCAYVPSPKMRRQNALVPDQSTCIWCNNDVGHRVVNTDSSHASIHCRFICCSASRTSSQRILSSTRQC